MKASLGSPSIAVVLTGTLLGSAALAADGTPFVYKNSFRNVTADPDGIWAGKDLAPTDAGTVTIHEYSLTTPRGAWLVSQIWNADCSSATCPTKLLRISPDGRRKVVVDDMMHQVIPPDEPRLAGAKGSKGQDSYARHPFELGPDGKMLINGDFTFPVAGMGK